MRLQVHSIPMGALSLPVGMARAYLIESDGGMVLVDAGMPHSEGSVMRRLRALGRDDLRLIFVTHAHVDHYGSAAALRRITGARIAIHRADADAMSRGETPIRSAQGRGRVLMAVRSLIEPVMRAEPTPPDILLKDGDNLRAYGVGCDAVVIHTPGHTPGSCCLLVDGRLAFVGDLLSTTFRPRVQSFFACDWSRIPGSFARLQELNPETVYAGHGHRSLTSEALQSLTATEAQYTAAPG
jgi:hydroxyacylglutathione hydrolase